MFFRRAFKNIALIAGPGFGRVQLLKLSVDCEALMEQYIEPRIIIKNLQSKIIQDHFLPVRCTLQGNDFVFHT